MLSPSTCLRMVPCSSPRALGASLLLVGSPVVAAFIVDWRRFLSGARDATAFFRAVAPAVASASTEAVASRARASAVGVDGVLEMVKQTAGAEVDADAPLMEAGVDSLGAVELRNQLHALRGLTELLTATEVPRSVGLPLSWQCRIPIPRRTRSE